MKELRKKLKDQSGASILLALLFFLLCSMVGASVLMAAMSNAGKIRSNRAEQQKYLLLSSALRLVCDELTSAEYCGAYTSEKMDVLETDDDGNEIVDDDGNTIVAYSYTIYTQKSGTFTCGLNGVPSLSPLLPLLPELDEIFAQTFPPSGKGEFEGDDIYKPLSDSATSGPKEHKLTLHVDTSSVEGLGGSENDVTVKVQMDQNLHIWLTATLGGETNGYTMKALLTGQGSLELAEPGSGSAGPVKWTLEWIAKKEAGDDT